MGAAAAPAPPRRRQGVPCSQAAPAASLPVLRMAAPGSPAARPAPAGLPAPVPDSDPRQACGSAVRQCRGQSGGLAGALRAGAAGAGGGERR